MKPTLFILFLFFTACSGEPKNNDIELTLNLHLYPGILKEPQCDILNHGLKALHVLDVTTVTEHGIRLPKNNIGFIISCHEKEADSNNLMLRRVFKLPISEQSLRVAVNPITELAYRLSHLDISDFKQSLQQVFQGFHISSDHAVTLIPSHFEMITPPIETADHYGAVIALLLYLSGISQEVNEVSILKLKGLLSDFEAMNRQETALPESIDVIQLGGFLDSVTMPQELKQWFKKNYSDRRPQGKFAFQETEVLRSIAIKSYQQLPVGGSGAGSIVYQSSNTSVASVDDEGKISFLAPGQVAITATKQADSDFEGTTATFTLTIKKEPLEQASLYFNQKQVQIDLIEGSYSQQIVGGSGNGLVFYRSSDSSVATIDNSGRLKLIGLGKTTISGIKGADDDYKKATVNYELTVTGILLHKNSGEKTAVDNMQAALDAAKPGDIFSLAGDHHFETPLRFNKTIGEKDKPIILQGHVNLSHRIMGTEVLEKLQEGDWQLLQDEGHPNCKNNCYKVKVNKKVLQLWVDDKMQSVARWPNFTHGHPADEIIPDQNTLAKKSGSWWDQSLWSKIDSVTSSTIDIAKEGSFLESLTMVSNIIANDESLSTLASQPSFSGGRLLILDQKEVDRDLSITNHQAGSDRIEIVTTENLTVSNSAMFIVEHRRALDRVGEYFYDEESRELWLWPPESKHPDTVNIKAKTQSYSLDVSGGEYLLIKGLDFFATTIKCESGEGCKGLRLQDNGFSYPVSHRSLMNAVVWSSMSDTHTDISFDPSLFSASYPFVDAEPWSSFMNVEVITEINQRYWLPGILEKNQAIIPLEPNGQIVISENVELIWLGMPGVQSQQVWMGTTPETLQLACDNDQITRAVMSRCKPNTEWKASTDYYWQVISKVSNEPHYSPVWRFRS